MDRCLIDLQASNDRGNIIVKRLEMIINHIRRYINRKYIFQLEAGFQQSREQYNQYTKSNTINNDNIILKFEMNIIEKKNQFEIGNSNYKIVIIWITITQNLGKTV